MTNEQVRLPSSAYSELDKVPEEIHKPRYPTLFDGDLIKMKRVGRDENGDYLYRITKGELGNATTS